MSMSAVEVAVRPAAGKRCTCPTAAVTSVLAAREETPVGPWPEPHADLRPASHDPVQVKLDPEQGEVAEGGRDGGELREVSEGDVHRRAVQPTEFTSAWSVYVDPTRARAGGRVRVSLLPSTKGMALCPAAASWSVESTWLTVTCPWWSI